MFKDLRNKFLILNLVIISFMMLAAFSSIYLITYNNVQRGIDIELHKLSEFKGMKDREPRDLPYGSNNEPPLERSVSFTLITDTKGSIISSSSVFDMDNEFYENAKDEVLSKNKTKGSFKLEGNNWAFIKESYINGSKIVFLDITSRISILTNLIYTFLIVAFVMLIIIFFISKFFANRAIKPIKEAFDKQKQFIEDASHELKTPLAVINTNVDVLLNEKDTNSKWLNYIKSEVERMTKLTNDLLYLTQIDYSDIKMIFSDFNLSDTVENVILTMEAVIFENNILLDYDIESNLLIHGNSEQIKQVIMILLDNALKYTNSNGNVNLALKKNNNNIVLSVTNSGKGIAQEYIDKLFDRFYRIDKSRSRNSGGYGLGLAIAKAIVEQHGGKIYAKSVLNESTTFTIELHSIS